MVWTIRIGPTDFSRIQDDRTVTHWAAVVAHFTDRVQHVCRRGEELEWSKRSYPDGDIFYDRALYDLQIFDPLDGTRDERSSRCIKLEMELGETFRRSGVAWRRNQMRAARPDHPKVKHVWETGYMCFVIVQDFMRRQQIALVLQKSGKMPKDFEPSVMWQPYIGLHDTDTIRQAMMLAYAGSAISRSNYEARIAIEIPGRDAGHEPKNLQPVGGSKTSEQAAKAEPARWIDATTSRPDATRLSWTAE